MAELEGPAGEASVCGGGGGAICGECCDCGAERGTEPGEDESCVAGSVGRGSCMHGGSASHACTSGGATGREDAGRAADAVRMEEGGSCGSVGYEEIRRNGKTVSSK